MKYIIVDLFGNEIEVSKLEFYVHKSTYMLVPIAGLLAFIGILIDIIRFW